MENGDHPLLSAGENDRNPGPAQNHLTAPNVFAREEFFGEFFVESKKLCYLASPAIFTSICHYSLGAITQVFAGHLGTTELAAVSVQISILAGFAYGIMWGMGSALETLSGIAFGAGELEMLGIYMQRSWVILNATAVVLMFLFIFATPILKIAGQTDEISEAAGNFALWMTPQLFAYAMSYPLTKFLQAQSKFTAMAVIAGVALVLHTFFSWLLILNLGWGLVGAAVVLNSSWWFIVLAQLLYILHGACGGAWTGFSWMAFQNFWGFLKFSLTSDILGQIDLNSHKTVGWNLLIQHFFRLETWNIMSLILFAGYLKNAEVSVDASSICVNIMGWTMMVGLGLNAAIRVSNELEAIHPKAAKFSAVVVGVISFLIGLFLALILIIAGKHYPSLFSNDADIKELVYELTPLLGVGIIIYNVQLSLAGVATGAGLQAYITYVNLGCCYLFGMPLSLLMGFQFNMGIKGIWWGVLLGTVLEACVMLWIISRTDWSY